MSLSASGRIWDDASSPEVARLAEEFEADWRHSSWTRPDPAVYLPADPERRKAALLALLRVDLALHWASRERVPVESYRDRYPELDGESLVALLYEEYCLREEAGETPEPAEYEARFPEVSASFREVLEIHGLIGHVRAPASRVPGQPGIPLPDVGQTIAGFRLIEELGQGAFARVFRAEERELADRPVALKVTRAGSREPQTLARLQHTHIVPVYSYLIDPATGLHLLCMPYLGRITLAQVLGQPATRAARSGADLIAVLDRLGPPENALSERSASRSSLARLPYARAIAWWGARMAEALQHAHDRGVLHRDVKPSNVLVTGDGLPMLLDFNLAHEPWIDTPDAAPAAIGGTIAYMAPERLEALAEGGDDRADTRSDLYALGVVLFDCLVRGTRSFALPSRYSSTTEALLRAAEARRDELPRLRDTHPDVPVPLEAVVRRCLDPDPDSRYASAAELAADLHAVADDAPLRFAREPLPSQTVRWLRRNRRSLAVAAPLVLALGVAAIVLVDARMAEFRLAAEVNHWIDKGQHAANEDHLELAVSHFATASRLAAGDARLRLLSKDARDGGRLALETKESRDKADELFAQSERLRFYLLGFGGDAKTACRQVEAALAKFSVPRDREWMSRRPIALLDPPRRERLLGEVNELLFLWVVALDRDRPGDPESSRQAVRICDAALAFVSPVGPWQAIRSRHSARIDGGQASSQTLAPLEGESTARGCFQWGLLCDLEGRTGASIEWLGRATRLEPGDYWSHFYLAYYESRAGQIQPALAHYEAAVALRPRSYLARYNRALLHHARGDLDLALDDLNRVLESARGFDFLEARLWLGNVKQALGDIEGARAAYEAVIASGAGRLARAGRLNRAKLDNDSGAVDRARVEYDTLLAEDPRDSTARLSRALQALRLGEAQRAEDDLTVLLQGAPESAEEVFARRALARLALGRPLDAESDAANAYRRNPSRSRERLWVRTLLAAGRVEELLWLDRPDDLTVLPGAGPSLRADLRAASERLRASSGETRASSALACRTRAVLLSALNDPAAVAEADRAVALAPQSADAYLVRARVRRRSGDRRGAMTDVNAGLGLGPGDPRLLELRGLLKTESGNPEAGMIDLNRAVTRGARGTVRFPKARTLMALGRFEESVEEWTRAVAEDPDDPQGYLGRALALVRLRQHVRAMADLDQAAEWAAGNADLQTRITLAYAACLPGHPERLSRWLALARTAWSSWTSTAVRAHQAGHRD